MRIALFAYDFPHRKTQDFLSTMWLADCDVQIVVAAPYKAIPKKRQVLRVKPRRLPAWHPRDLSERLGIHYLSSAHDDEELPGILRDEQIDLVVISGARILRTPVIEAPSIGIVNIHPGLIPEVRGLDALKWSVLDDHPPGVTVHFIDERIDAGRIIIREEVPVFEDDHWVDLSLRIDDKQVELLPVALEKIASKPDPNSYPEATGGKLNTSMSNELEKEADGRFESWREKQAARTTDQSERA